LQHLDPTEYEIFLYHNHAKVDAVSERLRTQAKSWKNLVGQTNETATKILRADQLDIAIDLAGHTGFNRLASFAQRVAPVQVTYLGYPNTTGLKAMDFRFVDSVTDPEGVDDGYYTEKRIRFSECGWAFSPPAHAPEPARDGDATLTFGSFNNPAKLSSATLRVWGRLLKETPSARLLLKGTGLTNPETRGVMENKLQRAGIDLARVDFMDRTPNLASHLEIYHRVDVALDPFPYAGTTTTCEALWMGVPVVTLAGDRHAARVGASLLTAIGHPEWIARSEDEYLEIAKVLATDVARRDAMRASLRSEMSHSLLLNHRDQAKRFGAALRACWSAK
jgi:predicted O-linked N-acetylglucosamine transferase (SPINDLY family)